MQAKEKIIVKYLHNRWYRKTLVISDAEQLYLNKINSLKKISCSGYLSTGVKTGCIFDVGAWPFYSDYFDLIILDHEFLQDKADIRALLNQLHFCLSDDGEIIVAGSQNILACRLFSKFLARGFLSKKIELINPTDNIFINFAKRILSKDFVAFFKKDNFFKLDPLEISSLVKKGINYKVCTSTNIKKSVREKI